MGEKRRDRAGQRSCTALPYRRHDQAIDDPRLRPALSRERDRRVRRARAAKGHHHHRRPAGPVRGPWCGSTVEHRAPRPGDSPSERRGRQVKIALHESLPLAVAAAGLATLGPQQDARGIHPPADRPPGQIAPEFRHDRQAAAHGASRQATGGAASSRRTSRPPNRRMPRRKYA